MNANAELQTRIISSVMSRISQQRRFRKRTRITTQGILGGISFVAFIVAARWSVASGEQSGFGRYVALLSSDTADALHNWKSLLFSIVESFPILEIAIAIGSIIILANALRLIARAMSVSSLGNMSLLNDH